MFSMATDESDRWEAMSPERVGPRVKEIRVAAGLTQEQLAVALDLSMVKLQRIERGEANLKFPDELKRACRLFGLTLDQFFNPALAFNPRVMQPFVLLVTGKPSPQLAERARALIADLNDEHADTLVEARVATPKSKPAPAPPRERPSRPRDK